MKIEMKTMLKNKFTLAALSLSTFGLLACTTLNFEPAADTTKFYADKLSCENQYTAGFNIWGNKEYGNVYKEGPARDCMLAKGYKAALK